MTHGNPQPKDWQNLVTIRPGPVLHVWRSGSEFCQVPLTIHAALTLIGQLTAAMQVAHHGNDNLPFETHKAIREAERKIEAADPIMGVTE